MNLEFNLEKLLNEEEKLKLWKLEDKIDEINIFIEEFKKSKEIFDKGINGFSTDAFKYSRLINCLERLIELEKEEFKRNI